MMAGQGSGGSSGTSGGTGGLAGPQQGNQRRSLGMAPMVSGVPMGSKYQPVHGSVALSGIPDNSKMPFNDNIPNLSFSLNPDTPAPAEVDKSDATEGLESDDLPTVMKTGSSLLTGNSLLMSAPTSRVGYLMPSSYSSRPSYVELAPQPILSAAPQMPSPFLTAPAMSGPVSTSTVVKLSPPTAASIFEGPVYYNQLSNEPLMIEKPMERPSVLYVNPSETLLRPTLQSSLLPTASRLLAARGLFIGDDDNDKPLEEDEPLVISMTNNGKDDSVKKIMLDPDNGIIVTQEKARKKREAAEASTEAAEAAESTTAATSDDATTTEKTSSNDEDEENFDPNGHGHGKTNKFKADGMMGDMMKQFMGYSKMFTARNAQPKKRQIETRRVKIDFLQNGEALPEGTVETISAGGGKAPGHHEGGGLTVKIQIPPRLHGHYLFD